MSDLDALIAPLDLEAWEARLDDRASVAVPLVRALIQRLRTAEANILAWTGMLERSEATSARWMERAEAAEARVAQLDLLIQASRKRRDEQSHWFGPDFFMPDKPLVEQAFLNACREEDAILAEIDVEKP